jgi:hypothetical protein
VLVLRNDNAGSTPPKCTLPPHGSPSRAIPSALQKQSVDEDGLGWRHQRVPQLDGRAPVEVLDRGRLTDDICVAIPALPNNVWGLRAGRRQCKQHILH